MTRKIIFVFPMVYLFSLYNISNVEGSAEPTETSIEESYLSSRAYDSDNERTSRKHKTHSRKKHRMKRKLRDRKFTK